MSTRREQLGSQRGDHMGGGKGFKDDSKSGNVEAWLGGTETVPFPSTFSSTAG